MPQYVALLRGIMPTNPNMRGAKIRGAVDELGHRNVSMPIKSIIKLTSLLLGPLTEL